MSTMISKDADRSHQENIAATKAQFARINADLRQIKWMSIAIAFGISLLLVRAFCPGV